jgi:hypothetical protein
LSGPKRKRKRKIKIKIKIKIKMKIIETKKVHSRSIEVIMGHSMRGEFPGRKTCHRPVELLMFQGFSWFLNSVFLPIIVISLRLIPGASFRNES